MFQNVPILHPKCLDMQVVSVAVGSTNPVKLSAALCGIQKSLSYSEVEEDSVRVVCEGHDVPSDVPDQPIGDDETKRGAINRARNAYFAHKQKFAEEPTYSVGMEGGVALVGDSQLNNPMECFAWIAIYNGEDLGVSRTASFNLPNVIRDLIMDEGMELGDADDQGTVINECSIHWHMV
jgi:inosine/xanthosine triphosphatase